jgi:hypothetical protein
LHRLLQILRIHGLRIVLGKLLSVLLKPPGVDFLQ